MPDANRSRLIELLNDLSDKDDAKVVASARDAVQLLQVLGAGWEDLIVQEGAEEEEEEEDRDDLEDDADEADAGEDDTNEDEDDAVEEDTDEADEDDADEDDADEEAPVPANDESPGGKAGQSDAALIDRLLAGNKLNADSRDDLETFKRELSDGPLDPADKKYLKALAARLAGKKSKRR